MDQALANMTGGITQRFDLRKDEAKQMVQNGTLWRTLMEFQTHGFLMGAGSPAGSDNEANASKLGIVQGHAYSILDIK